MKNTIIFLFFLGPILLFSQSEIKHAVYFDSDSFVVKQNEQNRLIAFIDSIKTIAIGKISIFGFCDDRGSDAYNLKLSNRRANAIKNLFVNHKIDSTIITNVDGKGEVLLKTLSVKDIKGVRGLNRKAEIIVIQKPIIKDTTSLAPPVVVQKEIKPINQTVAFLKQDLKVGDKITLKNILFKNGHSEILPESKDVLKEIAKILVELDNIYFTIQGHVCCTYKSRDAVDAKTKKRNLSLARAKFIFDYLASKGVKKNRMRYVGLKRKFPLNGDPKLDRRVEIKITHIAAKR